MAQTTETPIPIRSQNEMFLGESDKINLPLDEW